MIRIVLLEDHAIVREGVRFLLDQEPEFSVIAEFDSPERLFAALPDLNADILITDLDFEKYKGIEILQHQSAITSQCRTIVLSMHGEAHLVKRAMDLGAFGYVTKSRGAKELVAAIHEVHKGHFYLTDDILTANTYVGKLKAPLLDPALEGATDGAYRLYIKMERPFVHDAEGGQWDDLHIPQFPNKRKTYEVAHAVKDTGLYDGVILKNLRDSGRKTRYDKPADVYVVFDPKNIKSATTNVGTYDPNDPDIRRNPRRSPRSSRRRSRR